MQPDPIDHRTDDGREHWITLGAPERCSCGWVGEDTPPEDPAEMMKVLFALHDGEWEIGPVATYYGGPVD